MANDLRTVVETKVNSIQEEVNRRGSKLDKDAKSFQDKVNKGLLTQSTAEAQYAKLQEQQNSFQTYAAQKQQEIAEEALMHPVGSPGLAELSRGMSRVTIIASDHTRPVPSRLLIPPMLREIRRGNPEAEITILVATGCHRSTTRDELIRKFGEDIAEHEHIVVHDCDDRENLVLLGTLPSGGECYINRLACEADLLVAEGFLQDALDRFAARD